MLQARFKAYKKEKGDDVSDSDDDDEEEVPEATQRPKRKVGTPASAKKTVSSSKRAKPTSYTNDSQGAEDDDEVSYIYCKDSILSVLSIIKYFSLKSRSSLLNRFRRLVLGRYLTTLL